MTTTYTFEQLKADVKKEAEALRVHATSGELNEIKVNKFEPSHYNSCIYGMATGDCHSERAVELIQLCTPRYFKEEVFEDVEYLGINGIIKNVNGKKVKNFLRERTDPFFKGTHYSAIEAYILLPDAKNANLISYLRGETETLDL